MEFEAGVDKTLTDGLEFHLASSTVLDPDDAIVRTAQRRNAELIVIGLRSRNPVGKLLFGSVGQNVLLHADCPVLVVKVPE